MKRIAVALAVALVAYAVATSPALATQSATVSVAPLPQSTELQATFTVTFEDGCGGAYQYCGWYPEASDYAGAVQCPTVFDVSHGVWVGAVEDNPGVANGTSAFFPASSGTITICVYVSDENSNEDLVGSSTYSPQKATSPPSGGGSTSSGTVPSYARVIAIQRGCRLDIHVFAATTHPITGATKTLIVTGGFTVAIVGPHIHRGYSLSNNAAAHGVKTPPLQDGKYLLGGRFNGNGQDARSKIAHFTAYVTGC